MNYRENVRPSKASTSGAKGQVSDIGILGNDLIVFHAYALVNGHDRPQAISPIDEADCWRLGGTTFVRRFLLPTRVVRLFAGRRRGGGGGSASRRLLGGSTCRGGLVGSGRQRS